MRVLIVEDDPAIADGLAATLRAHGYATDTSATLAQAGASLAVESFSLVLLDLGLPDGDGLAWLRRLRAAGDRTPVIILTARDGLPDRISGLDEGADDYLCKPFEPGELLARMRAALRRAEGRATPTLRHGGIEVDPAARVVRKDGAEVALRAKEFALLMALLRQRGEVLSRARLEETLYSFNEPLESNALEVHVHHLRRKLGEGLIRTVRGVGYYVPRDA